MNNLSAIAFPVLAIAILLLSTGCRDEFDLVPDPDEVVEIPGFNGEGSLVPVKITDGNQLIGYYGGLAPRASADLLRMGERATGFVIAADGSQYQELTQTGHAATFPLDINNNGAIVGEYIPEGAYSSTFLPGFAFALIDGTFINLHPDGYFQSSASHITNDGIILGSYGADELATVACLFRNDSVITLLDPNTYQFSEVHSVNNQFALIYAYDGSVYSYHSYAFANGAVTQLNIPPAVADFSGLGGLNTQGLAAGFYVDNGRAAGITYDLTTGVLESYQATNSQGGYTYYEYTIMDINDDGLMVGRTDRNIGGLLQGRAMRLGQGFGGFADVTPENSELYSELVSVNNNGLALGYLGLPRKGNSVVNKLFVIEVR